MTAFSQQHHHLNPEKFVSAIVRQIQDTPQEWENIGFKARAACYELPINDYREFEIAALLQEATVNGQPIMTDRKPDNDAMVFFVIDV